MQPILKRHFETLGICGKDSSKKLKTFDARMLVAQMQQLPDAISRARFFQKLASSVKNPNEAIGFLKKALEENFIDDDLKIALLSSLSDKLSEANDDKEALVYAYKELQIAPKETHVQVFQKIIKLHAQLLEFEEINKIFAILSSLCSKEILATFYLRLGLILNDESIDYVIEFLKKGHELAASNRELCAQFCLVLGQAYERRQKNDDLNKASDMYCFGAKLVPDDDQLNDDLLVCLGRLIYRTCRIDATEQEYFEAGLVIVGNVCHLRAELFGKIAFLQLDQDMDPNLAIMTIKQARIPFDTTHPKICQMLIKFNFKMALAFCDLNNKAEAITYFKIWTKSIPQIKGQDSDTIANVLYDARTCDTYNEQHRKTLEHLLQVPLDITAENFMKVSLAKYCLVKPQNPDIPLATKHLQSLNIQALNAKDQAEHEYLTALSLFREKNLEASYQILKKTWVKTQMIKGHPQRKKIACLITQIYNALTSL